MEESIVSACVNAMRSNTKDRVIVDEGTNLLLKVSNMKGGPANIAKKGGTRQIIAQLETVSEAAAPEFLDITIKMLRLCDSLAKDEVGRSILQKQASLLVSSFPLCLYIKVCKLTFMFQIRHTFP